MFDFEKNQRKNIIEGYNWFVYLLLQHTFNMFHKLLFLHIIVF